MPPANVQADLNTFRITFYRRRVATGETQLTVKERVLRALSEAASLSSSDLATTVGASRTAVMYSLNKLIKDGIVERIEPERSPKQRYRLVRK